jgi:hypothetical protein
MTHLHLRGATRPKSIVVLFVVRNPESFVPYPWTYGMISGLTAEARTRREAPEACLTALG